MSYLVLFILCILRRVSIFWKWFKKQIHRKQVRDIFIRPKVTCINFFKRHNNFQKVLFTKSVLIECRWVHYVQTWPAELGQILLRSDTRLVFCNWKLMRTDIFLLGPPSPYAIYVNVQKWNIVFLDHKPDVEGLF